MVLHNFLFVDASVTVYLNLYFHYWCYTFSMNITNEHETNKIKNTILSFFVKKPKANKVNEDEVRSVLHLKINF